MARKKKKEIENAGVTTSKITWCDLDCEFADFPDEENLDGAKSCRTFAALWCKRLKKVVTKNSPCAVTFGQRRPKGGW